VYNILKFKVYCSDKPQPVHRHALAATSFSGLSQKERNHIVKKNLLCVAIGLWLFISGCASPARDTVSQASTINALLAGLYDGNISYSRLFDRLEGEMVLLDGRIYQIKADGKVYKPDPDIKTPFATICQFNVDRTIPVKAGTDYETIENLIDHYAPNQNLFYAIKITGQFRRMKTRSVPGQKKPYPPLKEVVSNQPEFHMKDVSGTIVGFRCPPYVKGINVPGYHLHFISKDRAQGGHVLSFEIAEGKCEIDLLNQYFLILPSNAKEFAETDLSRDRSKELKDVEK
jgi:acetolactate decarboxylase